MQEDQNKGRLPEQDTKGKQGVDKFPESEPVKAHDVSADEAQKGKKVDADPDEAPGSLKHR